MQLQAVIRDDTDVSADQGGAHHSAGGDGRILEPKAPSKTCMVKLVWQKRSRCRSANRDLRYRVCCWSGQGRRGCLLPPGDWPAILSPFHPPNLRTSTSQEREGSCQIPMSRARGSESMAWSGLGFISRMGVELLLLLLQAPSSIDENERLTTLVAGWPMQCRPFW